jgi:hypothetical protein
MSWYFLSGFLKLQGRVNMYTQIYQSSCFMGQWFKFVKQLLQMLLKALPRAVCIDVRYSAIRNKFGFVHY